jgi:hypothetical protein
MGSNKVQEIERAIGALTQQELEEVRVWLDEYVGPQPIDTRIQNYLAAGRLDKAIKRGARGRKTRKSQTGLIECSIVQAVVFGKNTKPCRRKSEAGPTSSFPFSSAILSIPLCHSRKWAITRAGKMVGPRHPQLSRISDQAA